MKHQEEAIARVVSLLKSWQDPFEGGGGLINVASGVIASDSVHHLPNRSQVPIFYSWVD